MNEPVQIDAIRRVRGRRSVTAATNSGSTGRPTRSSPPETTAVSAALTAPIEVETASRAPTDVTTSSPSTEAISTWYDAPNRFASANTSAGPAASSNFMPSNTTNTTTRSRTMHRVYVAFWGKDGRTDMCCRRPTRRH
jgi:hypothetical protein